ncbi:MAG TPA: hypothetical protein V6D14_25155 [Coleofasciculaceae cyanobacterium]
MAEVYSQLLKKILNKRVQDESVTTPLYGITKVTAAITRTGCIRPIPQSGQQWGIKL